MQWGTRGRCDQFEPFFKNDEPAMNTKPTLALEIEEWTREAILRWGDDWGQIASHISRRLSETDEMRRNALKAEAALTLAADGTSAKDTFH